MGSDSYNCFGAAVLEEELVANAALFDLEDSARPVTLELERSGLGPRCQVRDSWACEDLGERRRIRRPVCRRTGLA